MVSQVLLTALCLGLVAASLGLVRYVRDGRRLGAFVLTVIGGSTLCSAVVRSWTPAAVVILGSGLIRGEVPPLLAGRLRRAPEAQRSFDPHP